MFIRGTPERDSRLILAPPSVRLRRWHLAEIGCPNHAAFVSRIERIDYTSFAGSDQNAVAIW